MLNNGFQDTSPYVHQLAATTALDLSSLAVEGRPCCRQIELLSAGNLQITRPDGSSVTYTSIPAGKYEMQAKAIGASTTVGVLIYF